MRKGYRWRIGFSMSLAFEAEKSPTLPILLDLMICLISTANFGDVLEILRAQYAEGSQLGQRLPVRNPRQIDTYREGEDTLSLQAGRDPELSAMTGTFSDCASGLSSDVRLGNA